MPNASISHLRKGFKYAVAFTSNHVPPIAYRERRKHSASLSPTGLKEGFVLFILLFSFSISYASKSSSRLAFISHILSDPRPTYSIHRFNFWTTSVPEENALVFARAILMARQCHFKESTCHGVACVRSCKTNKRLMLKRKEKKKKQKKKRKMSHIYRESV